MFFMWGFVTVLNDVLVPHLKAIFDLNYTRASLIQFAFFAWAAVLLVVGVRAVHGWTWARALAACALALAAPVLLALALSSL